MWGPGCQCRGLLPTPGGGAILGGWVLPWVGGSPGKALTPPLPPGLDKKMTVSYFSSLLRCSNLNVQNSESVQKTSKVPKNLVFEVSNLFLNFQNGPFFFLLRLLCYCGGHPSPPTQNHVPSLLVTFVECSPRSKVVRSAAEREYGTRERIIVVVTSPYQENHAGAHTSAHGFVLESASPAWIRIVHLGAGGHGQP